MNWRRIPFVVIALVGIASLFAVSDEGFLPFFRYRSISSWSPTNVSYSIEVVHALDTTYRLIVSTCSTNTRVLFPWFGDSVRVIKYNDGFKILDACRDVSGFDTTILAFSGNQIIPRREGATQAIVKLPNGNEVLHLEVVREEWGLAVYGKIARPVAG